MRVLYSRKAGGWVVFELRTTNYSVTQVPISRAFDTEDEAIKEMHAIYNLRELLNYTPAA